MFKATFPILVLCTGLVATAQNLFRDPNEQANCVFTVNFNGSQQTEKLTHKITQCESAKTCNPEPDTIKANGVCFKLAVIRLADSIEFNSAMCEEHYENRKTVTLESSARYLSYRHNGSKGYSIRCDLK